MRAYAVVSLIVVGMWGISAALAGEGVNALSEAKDRYQKAEGEIEMGRINKHQQILVEYRRTVTKTAQKIKAEGELDAYLLTQKELARLDKEGSVPETLPASLPPAVLHFQQQCRAAMRKADEEAIRRKVHLVERYVIHLKGLVKALMSEDKIEEAKRINAESRRADFILADLSSRLSRDRTPVASRVLDGTPVKAGRSPAPESFKLIARIRTGHRTNDGTGSPVYIIINEDNSLKRRFPENPKAGAEQTFTFDFDYPVLRVESITVQIEGGDAWRAQGFGFQIVQGNQRTEMLAFGGGYFSNEREGGPTVVRKTFEFRPQFGSNAPAQPEIEAGEYLIECEAGGLCLEAHKPDVETRGCRVQIRKKAGPHGAPNQRWLLAKTTDGFLIRNSASRLCLDAHKSAVSKNGCLVHLWETVGEDCDPNQRWRVVRAGGGYLIKNVASGLCLDVHKPDVGTDGGKVQLWGVEGQEGDPNQRWTLVPFRAR